MEQSEKLAALLQKLKANKENVPLEVLETKYAEAYGKLKEEIRGLGAEFTKGIALAHVKWLEQKPMRQEYQDELIKTFDSIYEEGGYAKKIGHALYKNYSLDEVRALGDEIGKKYDEAANKFFHSKTCLYATAECFDLEDPKTPKIYNDLMGMFWEEEQKTWREPEPGELQNGLLIFVTGKKEPEKEGA